MKFGSEAKSLTDFHQSVVESADSIRDILGTFQIIDRNTLIGRPLLILIGGQRHQASINLKYRLSFELDS